MVMMMVVVKFFFFSPNTLSLVLLFYHRIEEQSAPLLGMCNSGNNNREQQVNGGPAHRMANRRISASVDSVQKRECFFFLSFFLYTFNERPPPPPPHTNTLGLFSFKTSRLSLLLVANLSCFRISLFNLPLSLSRDLAHFLLSGQFWPPNQPAWPDLSSERERERQPLAPLLLGRPFFFFLIILVWSLLLILN